MTPSAAAASSPPAAPATRGLSFRAKLVLGVCGLVLLTGTVVLWLAHRSARASTEALTGSVFREVSGRAATHTRGFVLRAGPVVQSLAQLADKGLAVEDPERLPPQLLAVLKANPGLSWVSYSDERGSFTGAYRAAEGGTLIKHSHIVNGKTKIVEYDPLPDGTRKILTSDDNSDYDPRKRPFYLGAKQAGQVVWLPPYVFYWQWVMAGVRAVLRDRAVAAGDLAELMGRLNNFIAADHGGDRFMTMHLSVIDSRTQTMRWVSAGHDPVIVFVPAEAISRKWAKAICHLEWWTTRNTASELSPLFGPVRYSLSAPMASGKCPTGRASSTARTGCAK